MKKSCEHLFAHRRSLEFLPGERQEWPPVITKGEGWDEAYAERLVPNVLPTVDEAVAWANDLVRTIDATE